MALQPGKLINTCGVKSSHVAEVTSKNCKTIDISTAQVIAVSKLPAMTTVTEFRRLLRRAETRISTSALTALAARLTGPALDGALQRSENNMELVITYAESNLSQQGMPCQLHAAHPITSCTCCLARWSP